MLPRRSDHLTENQEQDVAAFASEFRADSDLPQSKRGIDTDDEKKKKKRKKEVMPQDLKPEKMKEFLPPGAFEFYEHKAGRLRVFFPSPSGYRLSISSSLVKYGTKASMRRCIQWAWERFEDFGGYECPFPWVFDE